MLQITISFYQDDYIYSTQIFLLPLTPLHDGTFLRQIINFPTLHHGKLIRCLHPAGTPGCLLTAWQAGLIREA